MRLLFYIVAAVYPLLVFFCLAVLNIPLRFFALFVILTGALHFLSAAFQKKKKIIRAQGRPWAAPFY
jgi:hypothetical protein